MRWKTAIVLGTVAVAALLLLRFGPQSQRPRASAGAAIAPAPALWVFRPSDGGFYRRTATESGRVLALGQRGDVPLLLPPQSGRSGVAGIFRPELVTWQFRSFDQPTVATIVWGLPDDTPFLGDFLGDATVD